MDLVEPINSREELSLKIAKYEKRATDGETDRQADRQTDRKENLDGDWQGVHKYICYCYQSTFFHLQSIQVCRNSCTILQYSDRWRSRHNCGGS